VRRELALGRHQSDTIAAILGRTTPPQLAAWSDSHVTDNSTTADSLGRRPRFCRQKENWASPMEQGNEAAGPHVEDFARDGGRTAQRYARPPIITFVAAIQFLRAGVALCIGWAIWAFPNSGLDSLMRVRALAYLATHHALAPRAVAPFAMTLSAAYLLLTGLGLWNLQKWARNVLLLTSGLTVVIWIRYFALDSFIRNTDLGSALGPSPISKAAFSLITIVILMDALVFCCLAFYPDVGSAFAERGHV